MLLFFLLTHPKPKFVSDAMPNPSWRVAMKDDIHALQQNETWELVSLSAGKNAIGHR